MTRLEVQVGRDLRDAAADVGAAWRATEDGQVVATDRVLFQDWAALSSVLTPKRIELLRHLRQTSAGGVRALSRALGRDVKRVHADVVALADLGLITRNGDGSLSSSIDEIASTIRIAA